jgi:hypothetical protein
MPYMYIYIYINTQYMHYGISEYLIVSDMFVNCTAFFLAPVMLPENHTQQQSKEVRFTFPHSSRKKAMNEIMPR